MVRRFLILLGLGSSLLPAFGGCGVTEEGGMKADSGSGGSADGGGGLGGGQCFPGAKVCPDPSKPGELLCLQSDDPKLGCGKAVSCEPCKLPHATAKCADGNCAVDKCDPSWADCNNDPVDGCETDLTGDKNHCGTCETDCVASKGPGWICNQGLCEVNDCCPTGTPACLTLRDCDQNKANGCEVDVASDASNCKTCGNVCQLEHAQAACSQEACVVTTCDGGYANCDSNDVNGCETNINSGNKDNCGACGKKCSETNGGATCQGGACKIACHPGYGNCDGDVGNGCETDTKTSTLHCGACNKPCNPQNVNNAVCGAGACGYDSCKTGYADCDGNKANGCEIQIAADVNNCGACGTKCTAPSGGSVVCNNGACAQSCSSGLTNCSGACVNTGTNISHCGGCGKACSPPSHGTATCGSGSCGFNCHTGYHKCGSECKANNDPNACGSSCAVCASPSAGTGNAVCVSGGCGISCTAPTPLKCGTGCYDSDTDKSHCGNCTTVCADPTNGTSSCVSGGCVINCSSGYHKCGATCKGDTDPDACGTNCTDCPDPTSGTGSAACSGGTCDINCAAPTPDRCGSACVDKQNDDKNCGECGKDCTASSQTCNKGSCVGGGPDAGPDGGDGG